MELLIATVLSLFVILMLGYGYRVSSDIFQKILSKGKNTVFEKVCTLMQEQVLGVEAIDFKSEGGVKTLTYITPRAQTLQSPYGRIKWISSEEGLFYIEKPPYGGKEFYRKQLIREPVNINVGKSFILLSYRDKVCYVELLHRTRSKLFWKGW